jgi:hypothetical protein
MIEFKNRRVTASVGRTIKAGRDYEFFRFEVGMEGDIEDDVDRAEAHNQLFKEMMTEVIHREAAIRAVGSDSNAMDQLILLLRSLLASRTNNEETNENPNLPPY